MKVHGHTRQTATVTQTDSIMLFGYDWVAAHVSHPSAMEQLGLEFTHALIRVDRRVEVKCL